MRQAIRRVVESQRGELVALGHRIHDRPELPFQEEAASGWLADYLAGRGFEVRPGAYEPGDGRW